MRRSKNLSLAQFGRLVKGSASLQGIGLYIIVMIAVYTIGLGLQKINFISGYLMTEVILIALPSLIFLKAVGIKPGCMFDIRRINLRVITKAFNLSLIGVLAILVILLAVNWTMHIPTEKFSTPNPWGFILISCTITPLCEELMFRGAIQTLFKNFGTWKSVTYTAILFAFFHGSLIRLPTTFVIGLICGHLAASTKSIYPAIQAHAFINLVLLLMWQGLA